MITTELSSSYALSTAAAASTTAIIVTENTNKRAIYSQLWQASSLQVDTTVTAAQECTECS
jgi:hypothetical protein